MPTISKKLLHTTTAAVDVGCGGGCRSIKLSKLFHPKPHKYNHYNTTTNNNKNNSDQLHRRRHRHRHHSSASTSWTTTPSTTTFSPESTTDDSEVKSLRAVQGFGKIGGNSLAVEKDSDDPYVDFRDSMMQMIMEKQIYGREDLRELLNCFLQLNSPYYHGVIIRAFSEIWNHVLASKLMQ